MEKTNGNSYIVILNQIHTLITKEIQYENLDLFVKYMSLET